MEATGQNPHVYDICLGNPKVYEAILYCTHIIESIMKSLSEYLNTKRASFPRFFFLANDELLSILSNSQDVHSVQKYMIKCFEGIENFTIQNSQFITHMNSPEGEVVDFI